MGPELLHIPGGGQVLGHPRAPQGRPRGKPASSKALERGAREKPSLAARLRCKIPIKLTLKIFPTQGGLGKGAQMDSKCPLQACGCRMFEGGGGGG